MIGWNNVSEMTKFGMPGVFAHGNFDTWSPGYLMFIAATHNGISRLYETFGNGGADTQISEITGPSRDLLIETLRPLVALDNLSTYFRSVETAIIEMKEAFLAYVGQAIGGERAIAAAGNTWYIDTVNVNLSAEGESGKGAMDNLLNLLATQAKNVLLGSGAK
jgi:hypothetical protein